MDEEVIEILEKINSSIENLDNSGITTYDINECFGLLANDIIHGFNQLSDRLDSIVEDMTDIKKAILLISEKL